MRPCHYPHCYTWRVERGATCQLTYPDMRCGTGLMNKTSTCYSLIHGVSPLQMYGYVL